MSNLIRVFPDEIKMEDLFLSFDLTATRQGLAGTAPISFTGRDTIEIGMYKDGMAFGITNIEIDTALNLQPQIDITFKDLYGNLVFRPGNTSNFSKIFELPPAKFSLTFKGYLGKPVKYLLQLRSTSVNYVTSDGSFEIKAKFVPNIYGFFGDIPFKFLYAVEKLTQLRGGASDPNSMLNIVKNGNVVNEKVQAASEQYDKLKNKIQKLQAGGSDLYAAIADGTMSDNGTKFELSNIANSSIEGFGPINFNFVNKKNGSVYYTVPDDKQTNYGNAAQFSIITSTADIGSKGADLGQPSWLTAAQDLANKAPDIQKLLSDNLAAIDKATQKSAGSQLQQEVLDSQTIGAVMNSLAGEAAFMLGYIMEGAIKGFTQDRLENKDIIGVYYPLAYQSNTTDGTEGQTLYEQVPYPQATVEMKYIQDFMKAQYEGQQQAQKYKDEQEAKENGTDGAMQEGAEIKKRITNAEAFRPNPYANENPENVCIKMLQRSGIVNTNLAGLLTTSDSRSGIVSSEYENIKQRITQFRATDKEYIRTFATRITKFFKSDGSLAVANSWDTQADTGGTTTYRQYFSTFFNSMKRGGMDDSMFVGNSSNGLVCKHFICNGVLYHNESELASGFGQSNDVWLYIPSDKAQLTMTTASTGATDVSETLTGGDSDTTKPYASEYFKFYKISDIPGGIGDVSNPTLMLDYNKVISETYSEVNDCIVKLSKTAGQGVKQIADGDYAAKFSPNHDTTSKLTYVLEMTNPSMMSTLYSWCTSILADTNITDSVADQKQAEEDKKKNAENGNDGTSTSTTQYEPYSFDQALYNAIYHQFHHIANSWLDTAREAVANEGGLDSIAASGKLAEKTKEVYMNESMASNRPFSMSYTYAIQTATVSNAQLKKAIVNTSQLIETDTESSVFTMMSNIAQQNHFLLQSIPGGVPTDGSGISVETLFKPDTSSIPQEGTSLVFIWQPTPESRSLNNKGDFLYGNLDTFKQSLENIKGQIPLFEFGSPTNIIVKSIKATTDDNKVTGESIAAVDDIINPNNSSKKRAFDCSMLSVMQGRSYKISLEIIGNANFLPTQRFAIANLPIFTGLYWTSNVKHSITPNEMTTSIEAIKMKFDGSANYVNVMPITTANFKGDSATFGGDNGNNGSSSNNNGGTESLTSDGLNYDFIQKVKDIKLKNAADINALIDKYTSGKYKTFPDFFNSECMNKIQFCEADIVKDSWTKLWNGVIPGVWQDYGGNGINFLEFMGINTIIYNETGGNFRTKNEGVNGPPPGAHPGITYAFDSMDLKNGYHKTGYNDKAQKLAYDLYNNPKFISQFKSLPFGTDKRVVNTTDERWKSHTFPQDLFPTDLAAAVASNKGTFINEADFFKYKGRGFIGFTWREQYRTLVKYILSYTGSDATLLKYKGLWKNAPYGGNEETILDISTSEDWDSIFDNAPEIPGLSIAIHAKRTKYQYLTDLTVSRSELEKKLYNIARYISGDGKGVYEKIYLTRLYGILDKLSPSTKVTTSNNTNDTNKSYTPPTPPAGSSPKQVDAIKNTLKKLYEPTNGAGVGGMCGVYTVTAAKNYTTLLKDPNASIKAGAFIGGNAKDKVNRDNLEKWGYTVNFVGSKLTKKDLNAKLSAMKFGIGDVVIYWADDRPPGWNTDKGKGSQVIYGHIQIYQGKQYNNSLFATSVPNNYVPTAYFIYNSKPNEEWNLYVCRAPAAPTA